MRFPKIVVSLVFAAALGLPAADTSAVENQSATEAPTGFDDQTNGFVLQDQFEADKATFEEREIISDGLGPVYNAQSCAECHQNPVTGAISQVIEVRTGHFDGGGFIEHPGGSLIHARAINATLQERVLDGNEVRAFRTSLNTLGDGFVEAISDETLIAIANRQPAASRGRIAGEVIRVAVLEAGGGLRVGRFGWKNQHASLVSFSADAYLNEMGITNKFDGKGNIIESFIYNSSGNPTSNYTYKYDDNANQTEICRFKDGALETRFTYEYDKKGNWVKTLYFDMKYPHLSFIEVKIYDERGNLLSSSSHDDQNRLQWKHSYEYEYDSNGNWIKRTEFDTDDKPRYIVIRQFKYFE